MKKGYSIPVLLVLGVALSCKDYKTKKTERDVVEDVPSEMVKFSPIDQNPVFKGTGEGTWDKNLRERGYILYDNGYKMWYTGYNDSISEKRFLGLATSEDGIEWKRFSEQPILPEIWTEDMQVVKHNNLYYMFAEGQNDVAHMLTSPDGISWTSQGNLSILKENGTPIDEGPYGTPTVWIEDGKKYLYYERNDLGIWLASSEDFKTWTNVQDEPVLKMGPHDYDSGAVAANQIVKFNGRYYMFYHGSSNPDWMKPGVEALWTSNVAISTDLVNWTKYPGNPIVEGDHSSPILVLNGQKYILFTMHDQVYRYDPHSANVFP